MSSLAFLPTLNACLNATSAVLVLCGFHAIRRGRIRRHTALMLSATATSALFLVSYLTYHAIHGSTPYQGTGFGRTAYFAILISHSVLAALVVPLVLRTLYLAWRRRWESHRRWARWTLPIWLYVSVTGVVVYLMLYGLAYSLSMRR